MPERSALTPQQRLAISRRALVRQWQGDEHQDADAVLPVFPYGLPAARPARRRSDGLDAWGEIARKLAQRWWRRHPANAIGHLARPLLDRYAREEPAKLVTAAAAAGALAVLIKPWRLLSITAVAAAMLKSSDVADLVTTLLQKNTRPRKDPP